MHNTSTHPPSKILSSTPTTLLQKLIYFCTTKPYLIILIVMCALAWSLIVIQKVSLDAMPDLSDTQVIIVSQWAGQSPDIIEEQVTYPLSSAFLLLSIIIILKK